MGSLEIENIITAKEKELKIMLDGHSLVEQERLLLQRDKLEIQIRIKDLDMTISKSKNSIKQREIEIKLLTKDFWAAKNSGG